MWTIDCDGHHLLVLNIILSFSKNIFKKGLNFFCKPREEILKIGSFQIIDLESVKKRNSRWFFGTKFIAFF